MSISSDLPPAPADALVRARAAIGPLHDRIWAAAGDTDLLDVRAGLGALRSELAAIEAVVLVEVDQREVPRKRLRWGSTSDWLAHTAGLTKARAKAAVRRAHELTGDRAETLDALRAAAVSPTQAAVVVDGVAVLPGDRMLRRRAEVVLLDEATRLDATDLARAAHRVLDQVDPDRDDRRTEAELEREERAAHAQRFFSISDDGAGGVRVKGRGSLEDAAVIRAALLPLTKPEPAVDPATGEEIEKDPRDHGARTWDALLRLGQHALDTDLPPTSHGTKARVSVTIPIDDLLAGLGRPVRSGSTEDGLDLHPSVVRRLACDAEIIPVVLGAEGQVLDVGRVHRSATEAIWRALVTRDRHCAFPGCSRAPLMCHAHHVTHWADGGETCLANLVLLCGAHHRTVHHTPWRVRISPADRKPEFLPPPRHRDVDDPVWIRHRTRDHPLLE